jgi:hypothetical protein
VRCTACRLGETYLINPARGIDEVRTCCTQEGFGILEQEMFVLSHEALEFLAFSRSQASLVVVIEQPVKPCLALGIESLELDCNRGFSNRTGHGLILLHIFFELYRGEGSLSNMECLSTPGDVPLLQ